MDFLNTPLTREGLLAYFEQFLAAAGGLAHPDVLADLCLLIQSQTEKRVRAEYALKPSTTVPATLGPLMTLKQWLADPELRKLWAATWEHPVMKAGLQVIFQAGMPKPLEQLNAGVDFADFTVLRQGRYEGYYDALRKIEILKQEPQSGGNKLPDEGWGGADLTNPPEHVKQKANR